MLRATLVYIEQRQERTHGVDTLAHQTWSGAGYYDQLLKTVTGGVSSTAAMGHGVTESQFKGDSYDQGEVYAKSKL